MRREELEKLIFEYVDDDDVPDETALREYESVETELFEVREITMNWVRLKYLYRDAFVEPVQFPKNIHAKLRVGDVFLIMLADDGAGWNILWMSPPYESVRWSKR